MGFSQFQKTNKNWAFCFDPNNKPIILFFSHKNPNFVLQISLCSALYLQKKKRKKNSQFTARRRICRSRATMVAAKKTVKDSLSI